MNRLNPPSKYETIIHRTILTLPTFLADGGRGDNIVSDSSGKGLIIGLPIAIDTNFVAARAATVYNSYSACEYLSDNQISDLHVNLFRVLAAVVELSLSGNQITTINVDAFEGLTALVILRLNTNQITTIKDDALEGLTALSSLDLSVNEMTFVKASAFNGLTALTRLLISSNPFNCDDCDLEGFKFYLLNNTKLTIKNAICDDGPGIFRFVYQVDFTDCIATEITTELITLSTLLPTTTKITTDATTGSTTDVLTTDSVTVVPTTDSATVVLTTDSATVVPTTDSATVVPTTDSATVVPTTEVTITKPTSGVSFYNKNSPIIVGSIGGFIAVLTLIGAVFATCAVKRALNRKPADSPRSERRISWY
ncbi:SLIT3 [Mytilus edulis]|uniref:SLIT3 n=1 Tax=Mytilus edulis TaxID=6550 RepID=A0A8S3SDT4_MYTED|nr:SLIT3 [Mytilus edulis]